MLSQKSPTWGQQGARAYPSLNQSPACQGWWCCQEKVDWHIHTVYGEGIRLFDHLGTKHIVLEQTGVIESPSVTHLTFRVVK
jgi:hypothetical protein